MGTLQELINSGEVKMKVVPQGQSFSNLESFPPSDDINLLVLQRVEIRVDKLRLVGSDKVTVVFSGDIDLLEQIKDGLEEDFIGQKWSLIRNLEVGDG